MVGWECPTNPREASGLDPEAVHGLFIVGSSVVGIVFLDEALTGTRAAGIAVAVLAIYLAASGDR